MSKRNLFIVTGPYHLFNAINLSLNEYKSYCNDLLIVSGFKNASDFFERIQRNNTFGNVFYMTEKEFESLLVTFPLEEGIVKKTVRKCKIILRTIAVQIYKIFPSLRIKKFYNFPFYKIKYDNIFSGGYIVQFDPYLRTMRKRYGTKVFFFEDGLGDRLGGINENHLIRKILKFIYWETRSYSKISGKFFYSPEITSSVFNFPIIKQIRPCMSTENKLKFSQAFNYKRDLDGFLNNKIIYFHSAFELYSNFKVYAERDLRILNGLAERYPNYFAAKIHPRSQVQVIDSMKTIADEIIPEISCYMSGEEFEEKVLITAFSASVFNPKFIFDREPYVILTYKLIGLSPTFYLKRDEREAEQVINKTLFDAYKAKGKILIPQTEQEMYCFIDKIIGENFKIEKGTE